MEQNVETIDVIDTTKDAKKQFSRLGLAFLAGSVVVNVVAYALSFALKQWKPEWLWDTNVSVLLSAISMYLAGMPVMALIIKKMPKADIPKKRMSIGQFLLALIMCYPLVYGSNIVVTIITTVIGILKGSAVNNTVLNVVSDANMVVIILYMVICAPIMEELIFRKLIVDRVARFGQGVAIVVSGVMFGLFHGNLSQFMYATVLGMFLAFLYVKTGNIKITIGIHMVINFMGGVVSTLLLKAIKYEELLELSSSGDVNALMQFYMDNLPGWIAYMLYIVFIFAVVIAGIILLIVFRKRFKVETGEVAIPKGKRFMTVFVNLGMLAFCLFWIATIIVQLFA